MKSGPSLFSALALLCAAASINASADPSDRSASFLGNITLSASGTAGWVENVSRSSNPLDMRETMVYEATFSAGGARQIARNWLFDYRADLNGYTMPDFSRNNHYAVGVRGGLQRKFGLGPLAPVLRFNAAYAYKDARIDSADGGTLAGSINFSKRLIPSVRIGANAEWLDHYARGGPFDIQQRTISLDAAWDITDKWRLSGSAGRLNGKIVATASSTIWARAQAGLLGPAIAAYYNVTPSEVTNAYGPGWVTYVVEADVDLWSTAVTYAFSDNTSIDLRLSSAYATNIVNVRYLQRTWAIGLAHRF